MADFPIAMKLSGGYPFSDSPADWVDDHFANKMRPPFKQAVDFFKECLRERRFSDRLLWVLREDICVHSDKEHRWKFYILEGESGSSEEDAKAIYEKFDVKPFMFVAFIKEPDRTVVTLAADDYDFEEDCDISREDWGLLFAFERHFTKADGKFEFISDARKFRQLEWRQTGDIGPQDFFFMKRPLTVKARLQYFFARMFF